MAIKKNSPKKALELFNKMIQGSVIGVKPEVTEKERERRAKFVLKVPAAEKLAKKQTKK